MTLIEGAAKKLDAHVWEREANEHYVEPKWCSLRLFQEEEFDRMKQVWDPCCGFGHIPESAKAAGMPHVYASDLVDRGYAGLGEVADFLKCTDNQASPYIVCNPPFNIAAEFVLHALKLGATEKVAAVFPTARLNAAHWLHNTPLQRVWMMTPRPSMPPGHVISAGGKPGGGKMDYCWLVWDRAHVGAAEIRWLKRDGVSLPSHEGKTS
jgi:hypothetical protein